MFITKSSSHALFGLWILSISPVLAGDTYRPGDEFEDCGQCPVMVVIPSGSFSMGAPPVDQGRPYSEGELRPVLISEPFAVGKFEITYQQWEACVIDEQCPIAKRDDWSKENHPVVNVSWQETLEYTKWLSKKTRKPYRLLTEAEWEYVATGGSNRARFFGLTPTQVC